MSFCTPDLEPLANSAELPSRVTPRRRCFATARLLLPGLLLTATIAALALLLRQFPIASMFSPLLLAIVLGATFRNLIGTPASAKAGIAFALQRFLRLGIVLLGLQLSFGQLIAVGATGLVVIIVTLFATFIFTALLGRAMGIAPKLAELIAAGTSICGASAVVATNAVTEASEEDVAYAIACITLFGSLSMVIYPALPALFQLDAYAYGLWVGASIHEVAQVIVAGFQYNYEAGQVGTIAKLGRVIMLAPMVVALHWLALRTRHSHREMPTRQIIPVPWFVFGFAAMVLFNSLHLIPSTIRDGAALGTSFLLTVALGAVGLVTNLHQLRTKGLRPLLLGAAAWLFIASLSLLLIKLLA